MKSDTTLSRDTRTAILDAAEQLVAEVGVQSLTFDAVAKAANVSKGGVLYYFPSKEDLATAMIERATTEFDDAVAETAIADPILKGRITRAYLHASLGQTARTGPDYDRFCASITTALLNYPHRLVPVREQGERHQRLIEADGLDPVLATIIRLTVDGLWLAENFGLMNYDEALKQAVAERLLAWSQCGAPDDRKEV